MRTKESFWVKQKNDKVLCNLCPRHCKIAPGQLGLCFVRGNENGEMKLHTYGRSSGFCIDPIEKKPLNHYLPGSPVLSFGTAGCNLFCRFCQNWDMSKARDMDVLMSEASPEAIAKAAKKHECRAVAYTYNDPVIFYEYAVDTADACHELGLKNIAVTAGYITEEAREAFYRPMDAVNVDLKSFSESFYKKICGGQLGAVLETLKYLVHQTNKWVEITTLLIPDENDSDKELHEMCTWIRENLGCDVPIHFSAFHPDFKMMDKERTPAQTLLRACDIAKQHDLNYVYVGNIFNREHDSTYCPKCNQLLIERNWYQLGEWNLNNGSCNKCGFDLPGVFEDAPGNWGAKRQAVRP